MTTESSSKGSRGFVRILQPAVRLDRRPSRPRERLCGKGRATPLRTLERTYFLGRRKHLFSASGARDVDPESPPAPAGLPPT